MLDSKQVLRNFLLAVFIAQVFIIILTEIWVNLMLKEGSFILSTFLYNNLFVGLTFTPWFALSLVIGGIFGLLFPSPSELRFYLFPLFLWLISVFLIFKLITIIERRIKKNIKK